MQKQMWNLWKPPVIHCSSKLNEIIKLLLEHSQQASNVLFNYITVIHHLSTPISGHLSIWWLTAGCYKYHHYLINTLSICTPLDSLCPYHSFFVSLPSAWQERHLWLLYHGSCSLWTHLSCIHPITTESILIAVPVTAKLLQPTLLPKEEWKLAQGTWHLGKRQSSDIKKGWKGDTLFLSMETEPLHGKH